jgi:hypothetical protein
MVGAGACFIARPSLGLRHPPGALRDSFGKILSLQLPTVRADSDRFGRHAGLNHLFFHLVVVEVEVRLLWH